MCNRYRPASVVRIRDAANQSLRFAARDCRSGELGTAAGEQGTTWRGRYPGRLPLVCPTVAPRRTICR